MSITQREAPTPRTGAASDILLPAKKRAALYALSLAIVMELIALRSYEPGTVLHTSYLVTIGVFLTLFALAPLLRFGTTLEMLAIGAIGSSLLARFAIVLHTGSGVTGSGPRSFSIHAGLIVIYLLAFVSFDKRRAGATAICFVALASMILAVRFLVDPDAQITPDGLPHIRTLVTHAICIALLYVLADSKEQFRASQAAASALTIVAGTDELTGLANRRAMTRRLQEEIGRPPRHRPPFAVILVDLDRFKAVNDTHGHAAGDDVLVQAATTLQDTVGEGGITSRWGGEEFLVLAFATAADAVSVAERCRQAMVGLTVGCVGRVTASFGVAAHVAGDTLESLVARADDALYAAKANGRNRVEVAQGSAARGQGATLMRSRG